MTIVLELFSYFTLTLTCLNRGSIKFGRWGGNGFVIMSQNSNFYIHFPFQAVKKGTSKT